MRKPRSGLQVKSAHGNGGAPAPQAIEYKAADPGTSTVLSTDDEQGIVEALVSITGIVDRQNDIIIPGAYQRTLKTIKPNGHRFHDMTRRVAKTLVAEEWMPGDPRLPKTLPNGQPWPKEAGALYIKGQYNLKTQDGRDAFEDAKFFGPEGQWSIGYAPHGPNGARRRKDGVRELHDIDLWEWSDVSHGAAPFTTTLGTKDAAPATTDDGPSGFVSDPLGKAGFDPSQPRDDDGRWTDDDRGSSGPRRAGDDTANGLPANWLSRVLAGDSRFVEGRGGGGGRDSAGSASRNAEMDRRDAVDEALDKERLKEKRRRLEADAKIRAMREEEEERRRRAEERIASSDDPESLRVIERRRREEAQAAIDKAVQDEKERREKWQTSFDELVSKERARRRQWNAEHRRRTSGKALLADDQILFATDEPVGSDGPDGVEVKMMNVLAGSHEELRERVRIAASRWWQDNRPREDDEDDDEDHGWTDVVGTWPNRAVVCFYYRDHKPLHYEFDITVGEDGEVEVTNPRPVEIVATIVPATEQGPEQVRVKAALHEVQAALTLAEAAGVKAVDLDEQVDRLERLLDELYDLLDEVNGDDDDGSDGGDGGDADGDSTTGEPEGKAAIPLDEFNKMLAELGRDPIAVTQ